MSLYEDNDDEENTLANDDNDNDVDCLPGDAQDSDVEDLVNIDVMENEIEVQSIYDDSEGDDENYPDNSPRDIAGEYISRDNTIWKKSAVSSSQTRSYNIIRESGEIHTNTCFKNN